ncbi:hypothetical protein V8E55_001382 [Tylopilus felleus]
MPNPSLHTVPLDRLLFFLASIAPLKNDILLMQPSNHTIVSPPAILPVSVQSFLSQACSLPTDVIQELWSTFKNVAWQDASISVSCLLPGCTLYPPVQYCSMSSCPRTLKGMRMMHAEQWQCVLYTVSDGPLPVYSVHLSCEACEVNYHHNFKVYKGERTYYGGVPDIIQASEHQFIERQVIEIQNSTSATTCANFYNTAMSQSKEPPPGWAFSFALSSDHMWSAFSLLCLLEDAAEREEHLVVKHTSDQKDYFVGLVQAHNECIQIEGQPEVTHFCDKCTCWYLNGDGNIDCKCSVAVMDGVCISHPCCSRHNCHVPLRSGKDCFCPIHARLENVCLIVGCERQVLEGHLTCKSAEHQEIERCHREKGQSCFQLRDRLQRACTAHSASHTSTSRALSQLTANENDNEEFTVHSSGHVTAHSLEDVSTHQDQPLANTRKVCAKFTRSRTHNGQLAVAPCGMILGRDTMFGAEGIASVAEFIKRTFHIEALKPDHIFFDNNCLLAQHVKADLYFCNIGLTVDVFHFKTKHKETHMFCQEHCNPAVFPELIGADGEDWFFNSSVAEQVNIWIGGYHAICRKMLVDKYDFFLDQMILRCNHATKAKLCRSSRMPLR